MVAFVKAQLKAFSVLALIHVPKGFVFRISESLRAHTAWHLSPQTAEYFHG